MKGTQSNTQRGVFQINSGADLTDLEGRLVKLVDGGSKSEAILPETVFDLALFVVDDGGDEDQLSDILPLGSEQQTRVRANGTGSAGDILVLADPTASSGVNAGKVVTLPSTEGVYFSPGIAEEDFVDEQLVAIRPLPRLVHVGTAFTSATPAATAPTNSTPYGFSQAQAQAILDFVREARAYFVANKLKANNV